MLLGHPACATLGDIAGQPERGEGQIVAALFEKARKRADEFEDHVVDVEHQQRTVVAGQFGDLAGCLWIVTHVERS